MKQKIKTVVILFLFVASISFVAHDNTVMAQVEHDPYAGDTESGTNQESSSEEEDVGLARCEPGDENCCGDVKTSIIGGDFCDEDEEGVIFGLLKWVLRIMTAGVGIAAVGGIAYGALLYTSAENKPEQTKKAIGVITNVVVGIVAYALMAVFLNFLIPGGIFE